MCMCLCVCLCRAYSVDPDRMLNTAYNHPPVSREKYQRPTSSQSEYAGLGGGMKRGYTNGLKEAQPRPPSSQGFMLDQFISTLPPLDFGSPDPDGELANVACSQWAWVMSAYAYVCVTYRERPDWAAAEGIGQCFEVDGSNKGCNPS